MVPERPGISVLTPTRNRPDNVRRLLESAQATQWGSNEYIFYVDSDDPTRDEVQSICDEFLEDEIQTSLIIGDRCVLSQMWNECASVARLDIMMQCGDDIIFRSMHWDQVVLNAFDSISDKIGLVFGRDGYQDANMSTHGFIHRAWVDAVGYFVPPYFASDYNDAWLYEVSAAIGRRYYVPEIYTEHMHPVVGKGPLDITHQERMARHQAEDCDRLWRKTKHLRQADAAKLNEAIRLAAIV